MTRHPIILILAFSLTISCTEKLDSSLDPHLLPVLKKFQKVVANNPDKLKDKSFGIADQYHWIVESNFKKLFDFIEKGEQEEVFNLFKENKIMRIEVWDKNCILFKIRTEKVIILTTDNWEELYVAYYDNCECVCHNRINEINIPKENISILEDKWYKVIAKEYRYIGG